MPSEILSESSEVSVMSIRASAMQLGLVSCAAFDGPALADGGYELLGVALSGLFAAGALSQVAAGQELIPFLAAAAPGLSGATVSLAWSGQIACVRSGTATHERDQLMNANKAMWEKGDFTRVAETMRDSGAELVGELGITEKLDVLDLGCGDGTTAIPAAQLGAEVLGVDIASNLVAAGNVRADSLGLNNCRFAEGDASDLRALGEADFDLTVSIFGAMFAPRPSDVAKEMVRVTRPGGRIVMGNWIPNDPTLVAQILRISASYSPPPPEGLVSPMTWGLEDEVIERFGAAGVPAERISFGRGTWTFNYSGSPVELVAEFKDYYGPTMNAFEAAAADGREADLQAELEALFVEQNTSDEGTSIPATFLRVRVDR